jgi:hypothetical protein
MSNVNIKEGTMLPIPNALLDAYVAVLKKRNIPLEEHSNYKKWLRYYLDFCSKYHELQDKSDQANLFSTKLREKNQTEAQRAQAAHLGHTSLKTTMIYTHCVPVRTVKDPRSPLDF